MLVNKNSVLPFSRSYIIIYMILMKIKHFVTIWKDNWALQANNWESANHILKARTEWKKQDIPKFIEEMYGIVEGEQLKRCRSIRGIGDYTLDERFVHHYVDLDKWSNLSEESKEKRERKFFNDKGKSSQNIVFSADGQRTVYTTPNAGKKLNQATRKRAERSRCRTPSAKRKLIAC